MIVPSLVSGAGGALLDSAGVVVVAFFVVLHTATALLLLRALPELWRHWDLAEEEELAPVLASEALPTVSVVVTGMADQAWTVDGVRSLLTLRYPRHEVVLVHDGEASGYLPALVGELDLYQVPPAVLVNVPTGAVRGYYRSRSHGKLFVIDKAHAGLADDLNAALNASRFPYILTMDVGTMLEADALPRLMRPFLLGARVAAVAGTARVANGRRAPAGRPAGTRAPSAWLPGIQAVELLRDMAYGRIGWNRLGGQLPVHGGVLLHRRDHLLEVDGYRSGSADPELDLVVRLRDHLSAQGISDAIPAIPEPMAWTLAPTSPRALGWRRGLAHRGQLEVLRAQRAALFSARYGAARLLAPLHLLAVAALAPMMELAGYLLLALTLLTRGASDPFVPLFILAVPGYALLLSLWAAALEAVSARRFASWRDDVRLCAFAVAEQLGYRQWMMWSRLRAAWITLRGGHSGDAEPVAPAVAAERAVSADRARAR